MRPQSIVHFERLFLLSVAIGLAMSLWTGLWISAAAAGLPAARAGTVVMVTSIGLVLGLLVNIVLWYCIARRGAGFAKWLFAAFFVVSLLGTANALLTGHGARMPWPMHAGSLVQLVLHGLCLWLLFRPDSEAWFAAPRG